MSFLGSALAPIVSTIGGLIGGSMQSHSAQKQAELEARLQRENWEYSQKNAHQFEVEDLRAAGLNPILSANHSQLASMPAVSIPAGPSAYGNIGSNLASALQASMHNDIERGKLENEKLRVGIESEKLDLEKQRTSTDITFKEKEMDEIDNRISIAIKDYNLREKLANADIGVKHAAQEELYSKSRLAVAQANLTEREKDRLDVNLKYGSILASYLPSDVRGMVLDAFVTWCKGHQDTIEEAVDSLMEIANSNTSVDEKASDVKDVFWDLFKVKVTYDPSLLTNLIKVKRN